MRAIALVFGIITVLATAEIAAAQTPPAEPAPKKMRLSQSDFDEGFLRNRAEEAVRAEPAVGAETVDPADIIRDLRQTSFDEKAVKKPQDANAQLEAVKSADADSKNARSMLEPSEATVDPAAEMGLENRFVTPRLRGPTHDRKSDNTITSKTRWTFRRDGSGSSCSNPASSEAKEKKMEALKEVLNRFTGNDDFYESECGRPCPDKKSVSHMIGLEVARTNRTEFDIEQKGIECFYQIRRKAGTPWQALQRTQATCTCK